MVKEFDSSVWTGTNGRAPDIRKILDGKTVQQKARESWKWLTAKIQGTKETVQNIKEFEGVGIKQSNILRQKDRSRTKNSIGRMYFFVYDPKHKKTLPYYDRFPLIFPIESYKDGFLGINLHYLDPRTRAILFGQLTTLTNNKKYNDTTKLKISYAILKRLGDYHKPCIKRYLSSHVRSHFIEVKPEEWDKAIFLPVESFAKESKKYVWQESKRKIK